MTTSYYEQIGNDCGQSKMIFSCFQGSLVINVFNYLWKQRCVMTIFRRCSTYNVD